MKNSHLYTSVKQQLKLPSSKVKNSIIAFLSGGFFGAISQIFFEWLLSMQIEKDIASSYIIVGIIFITSICTALGYYDKVAQICGAGLFIPISGFANAMTSCALESKAEGLIYGIGSNMFKLAGSVLTYGIVSAFVFSLIRSIFLG